MVAVCGIAGTGNASDADVSISNLYRSVTVAAVSVLPGICSPSDWADEGVSKYAPQINHEISTPARGWADAK